MSYGADDEQTYSGLLLDPQQRQIFSNLQKSATDLEAQTCLPLPE